MVPKAPGLVSPSRHIVYQTGTERLRYAQSLAPDRRSAQSKVIEMMRPKLALPAEVTP
jgi:hypothetical protein